MIAGSLRGTPGVCAHCSGPQGSGVPVRMEAATLCQGPCGSSLSDVASLSSPEAGAGRGHWALCSQSRRTSLSRGPSRPDPSRPSSTSSTAVTAVFTVDVHTFDLVLHHPMLMLLSTKEGQLALQGRRRGEDSRTRPLGTRTAYGPLSLTPGSAGS